jgi:signal transduction histidine kinase
LIFGAALPGILLFAVVGVAGGVFRLILLRSMDRALLSQAAVESVSLFDGPVNAPHIHLGKSPLKEDVRSFVPTVGLYEGAGKLVAYFPEGGHIPDPPAPGAGASGPELVSRTCSDGREVRKLSVAVRSPEGTPYVLTLEGSLGEIDATLRAYWQATLGLAALGTALLFGLQWMQAARMSRWIGDMTAYLPRLRGGEVSWLLPSDPTGDEIADLRVALSLAMERLQAARDAQERLIANAAHELRTPLGLMRTEMDLALRKDRSAAELREALTEARAEVDRLARLSASLLEMAALGKVTWKTRPGDVAQLVREAVEACEATAAERGVRVALEVPDVAPADFDALTMRQAIDNYLANALTYAPAGSTVHVCLQAEGDAWVIAVRDEGEGVPAEEAERIFEPFYRGSKSKKQGGAGLGLSIVREIARHHGGKAYLRPTEGKGATFAIAIPRQRLPQ